MNKCSGLSKSITNLKEIKLTVNTMLKCGFFSYNVARPYIAKLRSYSDKNADCIRRIEDTTILPDLSLYGSHSSEASIIRRGQVIMYQLSILVSMTPRRR